MSIEAIVAKSFISKITPMIVDSLGKLYKDIVKDETFWNTLEIACETQYAKHYYANTLLSTNNRLKLEDIYLPARIRSTNKTEKDQFMIDGMPHELLESHSRILITDSAGMGKSTLLRYIYLKALESSYEKIPVLIDLRKLFQFDSIYSLISYTIFSQKKEFDPLLHKLFETGKMLFLFDGFDEIPKDKFEISTQEITKFSETHSNNKFILTSRPEIILNSLSSFQAFKLDQLSIEDARTLIKKYSACTGLDSDHLILELSLPEHRDVVRLLGNPLMVTLLVLAYTYKKRVPLRRSTFYYQVYDALFEKHDSTKPTAFQRQKNSELDMHQFTQVLNFMAAISVFLNNYKLEYTQDELLALIKMSKNQLGLNFSEKYFFDDLLQTVPIFIRDGNFFVWTHKSFLDYFCACWLQTEEGHKMHETALKRTFEKASTYSNILSLYYELKPIELEKRLFKPFIAKAINFNIEMAKNKKYESSALSNRVLSIDFAADAYILKQNTDGIFRPSQIISHLSKNATNHQIKAFSTGYSIMKNEAAEIVFFEKEGVPKDVFDLLKACKIDVFQTVTDLEEPKRISEIYKNIPSVVTKIDEKFMSDFKDESFLLSFLEFVQSCNKNTKLDIKKCIDWIKEIDAKISDSETDLLLLLK